MALYRESTTSIKKVIPPPPSRILWLLIGLGFFSPKAASPFPFFSPQKLLLPVRAQLPLVVSSYSIGTTFLRGGGKMTLTPAALWKDDVVMNR